MPRADGALPWKLPGDMAYFKQLTSETRDPSKCNVCIMGRKTWESIPERFRPLAGRENIVLSRDPGRVRGCDQAALVMPSLDSALAFVAERKARYETVFVIGGGQIYA